MTLAAPPAAAPGGNPASFDSSGVARRVACVHGERRLRLRPKYAQGLREARVCFARHGAADAPLVIVQGGISAGRDAAAPSDASRGWWDALVGPGLAIDTLRFGVLSIDWLVRADLETGAGVDACDPLLAIGSEDQADALAALLDALGVGRVQAWIGASYGAMAGLAFAARHPGRLQHLIAIAGAHRAHPFSIALRHLQREIVRLGTRLGEGDAGLDLARRLAMTTYRTERDFAERFDAPPEFRDGRFHFAGEDWLAAAGRRFVQRFDAARFLDLSESIDLHAIAPERVRTPTTLIGFATDRTVPLADLCELQRRCGAPARLHVIDSVHGHDAFLKEPVQVGALLADALARCGAQP